MQGTPMLTENGKNILSKSIASKVPIILSSMALGDGISSDMPITDMINIVLKKEIENYSYDNGQAYVRSTFTNENLTEGFYIREIGIYAVDPDDESEFLFAYTNAQDGDADYFSPGTGKVILKEIIEVATGFSGSQDIHLTIDSSTAMVTIDEFNNKINEINQVVTEKANKTDIITTKTIQAIIPGASWEGSTAPYTQTITVDGILSTDNPIVDVILSDSLDTAILEEKAWGNISKIVTNDGSITAICNKKKPVTGVRIQLKVVR